MCLVRTPSSARRIARNRTHFRRVSRRYAALRTFHGSSVDRTVEALESLERPITLLDVGVGTGRYLLPIIRRLKQSVPGSVYAVGVDAESARDCQISCVNGPRTHTGTRPSKTIDRWLSAAFQS